MSKSFHAPFQMALIPVLFLLSQDRRSVENGQRPFALSFMMVARTVREQHYRTKTKLETIRRHLGRNLRLLPCILIAPSTSLFPTRCLRLPFHLRDARIIEQPSQTSPPRRKLRRGRNVKSPTNIVAS